VQYAKKKEKACHMKMDEWPVSDSRYIKRMKHTQARSHDYKGLTSDGWGNIQQWRILLLERRPLFFITYELCVEGVCNRDQDLWSAKKVAMPPQKFVDPLMLTTSWSWMLITWFHFGSGCKHFYRQHVSDYHLFLELHPLYHSHLSVVMLWTWIWFLKVGTTSFLELVLVL